MEREYFFKHFLINLWKGRLVWKLEYFPENSIALLRVNWYAPYIQGQENKTFSTRGGMSMSCGIRIMCGMVTGMETLLSWLLSEGSEIHAR